MSGSPQYNNTVLTFTVDLKATMGAMWDTYNKFILKPKSISNGGNVILQGGSKYGIVTYNMRGLNWVNMKYETAGTSSEWAPVFQTQVNDSMILSGQHYTNNDFGYCFTKGQQIVDIELMITVIDASGVGDIYVPTADEAIYNDVAFHFVVEPVIAGTQNEYAFYGFNSNPLLDAPTGRLVDSSHNTYTYSTFDLSQLCNGFWNSYNDFEIELGYYQLQGNNTITDNDRIIPVEMSGLNFSKNMTKRITSYDSSSVIIGTVIMNDTGITETAPETAPVTFKKSGNNVSFAVKFKNYDNTPNPRAFDPHFSMGFFIKPIYNVDKATLYINPWGLSTSSSSMGIRDASYNTFTLSNVNMRQVCGDMWDKYTKFNIFLSEATPTVQSSGSPMTLQMEGLEFVNQTGNVATLGSVFDGKVSKSFGGLTATFAKTTDSVNLKLTAVPIDPAVPFASDYNPLASNYKFTIVGIPDASSNAISTMCYVFMATGGYTMERGFDDIKFREPSVITQYDVTDSVQVKFDVSKFNQKLGLIKDASNNAIVDSSFNPVSDTFAVDSITLSASEFVQNITATSIVSVGRYSTLYSDFTSYVKSYFGFDGGFSSLFAGASEFNIDNGVFDANGFVKLINGVSADSSGSYINDLSGSITVSDINRLLRYAVDANVFGNRDPSNNNFGVAHGFMEGDVIWIPGGTTIKLNVDIDAESFQPVNNVGTSLTQDTDFTTGNFSSNTSATTTNITRTLTAPLLIRLVNSDKLSVNNFTATTNTAVSFQMVGISSTDINNSSQLQQAITSSVQSALGSGVTVTYVSSSSYVQKVFLFSGRRDLIITTVNLLVTTISIVEPVTYITNTLSSAINNNVIISGINNSITLTANPTLQSFVGAISISSTSLAVQTPTPAGPTGSTGTTGVSGVSGTTGTTSTTGPTGVSGTTGVSGVSGTTGPTGVSGTTGTTSTTGPTGVSGTTSTTGSTGTSGVSGTSGPTGVSGTTGTTGVSGTSGTTGLTGTTGTIAPTSKVLDITKTMDTLSLWIDAKDSSQFVDDITQQTIDTRMVTHVVGSSSGNTLAYSYDGLSWTGLSDTVFTACYGTAYNGNMWLAFGTSTGTTIAYSYDGINWTSTANKSIFTNNGTCGLWTGTKWLAGGNGTNPLAQSINGYTWSNITQTAIKTEIKQLLYISNYNRYYAVGTPGTGGNSVAYSSDTTTWTMSNMTATLNTFTNQIAYGNNMIVAVGQGTNNNMAYSTDGGITWSGLGKGVISAIGYGVAYNNNMWVAVCQGTNSIAYSTNGTTWTGITGKTIFSTAGRSVTWNGYFWIAYGQGTNNVAYSYDGINWIGQGINVSIATGITHGGTSIASLNHITTGVSTYTYKPANNKIIYYVSVGSGGNSISYSQNGSNWTAATNIFSVRGYQVAFNGAMYVATGEGTGNSLAYSYDGIKWTGLGKSIISGSGYGLACSDSMWVAGGYNGGSGGNTLAYSYNGITWTGISGIFSGVVRGTAYNAGQWIAVGNGGNTVATSYNGIIWTGQSSPLTTGWSAAYGQGKWIIVGEGTNTIAYSTNNGSSWTGLGATTFTSRGSAVAYNGTSFVAVGSSSGGGNSVAYSVDGIVWQAVSGTSFGTYGSDIKWTGNNWIASGADTTNYYIVSSDGTNWSGLGKGSYATEATCIAINTFTNNINHIALLSGQSTFYISYNGYNWIPILLAAIYNPTSVIYANGQWAISHAGGNGCGFSIDGYNWRVPTTGVSNQLSIAYGNGLWILMGSNSIRTSTDTITWATRTSVISSNINVAVWNNSLWLMGGTGTNSIATSLDGLSWTGRGTPTGITNCSCALWAFNQWIIGGSGTGSVGLISTSQDGINWTNRFTGTTGVVPSVTRMAFNGSMLVACSSGTTPILTSTDGINWISRNVFSGGCHGITWNGSAWVAVSSAGIMAYSTDGIIWTMNYNTANIFNIASNYISSVKSVIAINDKSLDNNVLQPYYDISYNALITRKLYDNTLQLSRFGYTTNYYYSGTAFSYFMVVKINNLYTTFPRLLAFGNGTTNDASNGLIVTGTATGYNNASLSVWHNNVQYSIGDISYGSYYLVSGYFDGSNANVGLNGNYNTYSDSATFSIQKAGLGINTYNNSESTHTTEYGEVLVFKSSPTLLQRQTLEAYLAWKWNLVALLPVNHPFKTISPYKSTLLTYNSIQTPMSNLGYAGRIVEPNQIAYYPYEDTGTALANYADLVKYPDNTYSGVPSYDANIVNDLSIYYNFNLTSVSGLNIANMASGSNIFDASISSGGSINTTTTKYGTGSLRITSTSSLNINQINIYPLGTSFAFWLKSNANANNSYIFNMYNNGDLTQQSVYINIINNSYVLNVFNSSSNSSSASGSVNINNNTWIHLVWTLDIDGIWKTYINGTLTDNFTGKLYPSLGLRNTCGIGKGAFTDAYIDEFMMYNRVLTPSEVSTIYGGSVLYTNTTPITTSTSSVMYGQRSLAFPSNYTGTVALNPLTLSNNSLSINAWIKPASLSAIPMPIVSLTNSRDYITLSATNNNYVLSLSTVSINISDLYIYYKFDTNTASSSNIANLATNASVFDASLISGALDTTVYKYGNASLPLNAKIEKLSPVIPSNGMSFSLWMNTSATNAYIDLFRFYITSYSNTSVYMTFSGVSNILYLTVFKNGVFAQQQAVTATVNNGVWNHIVWTLSSGGEWKIYINNVLLNTYTAQQYPIAGTYTKAVFGSESGYSGGISVMDDFRMYNRVISATEVLKLYNYTNTYYVPAVPTLNSWNHVIASMNANDITLYVNKNMYSTTIYNSLTLSTTYTKCTVGYDISAGTKFDGFIDDFRMFNSTLSTGQVAKLYDGAVQLDTLLAHYTFDPSSVLGASIANYASGLPVYDASITNTALVTTTDKCIGQGSLYFDSVNYTGSVKLGSRSFALDTSGASICAWFKLSSLNATTPRTIWSMGTGNNKYLNLKATATNYVLNYFAGTDVSVNVANPLINTWNHMVVTIANGATNIWSVYLNGQKSTFTVSASVDLASVFTNIYVGQDASTNTQKMHGYVDDMRFYNKVLSDTEALNLYNTNVLNWVETSNYDLSGVTGIATVPTKSFSFASATKETSIVPTMLGLEPVVNRKLVLGERVQVPTRLVAVGSGGNSILYSADCGSTWTKTNATLPLTSGFGAVAYGKNNVGANIWVAVGAGTAENVNSIHYSFNGTVWFTCPSTTGLYCTDVAYGFDPANKRNIWLSTGGSGATSTYSTIQYSLAGTSGWTKVSTVRSKPIYSRGMSITCGQNTKGVIWVVGAYAPSNSNTLAYSVNPTVASGWVGIPESVSIFYSTTATGACNKVAYGTDIEGNHLWIAMGNNGNSLGGNTMATSSDGIKWTGRGCEMFSKIGYGVAQGKDENNVDIWVAVGQGSNSIAYSYDGISGWVGVPNSTSVFSMYGRSVHYVGGRWYATGKGNNTMAISEDGRNWVGLGNKHFTTHGLAICGCEFTA